MALFIKAIEHAVQRWRLAPETALTGPETALTGPGGRREAGKDRG
eukprot:CAMPEP_0206037884 /NCGR_PEP_ID=MMETSP1466-20131121/3738_1 /ASSEMBLY_ACC=CAM_ASM_001126 /TAXON_ID=44452 /ORGANISM="Pavlova gyrans, Strain CCMP608" /LENGTH=44 /DNA_ID= /DNA_START= /DNA_END= /DNA_ORIENTATION=